MEQDFESDFYNACCKIDKLHRLVNLAVSILENDLSDDDEVVMSFMSKADVLLNEYYQSKLSIDQYLTLNKGAK
jgi:hypothetical protein